MTSPDPELWHSGCCPVGSYSETDKDHLRTEALKLLRSLTSSLWDLVKSSEGLTGLHLNGDIATWDYLMSSGWLKALQDSQEFLEFVDAPVTLPPGCSIYGQSDGSFRISTENGTVVLDPDHQTPYDVRTALSSLAPPDEHPRRTDP